MHVFRLWEEARVSRGNLCSHGENMQTSTQKGPGLECSNYRSLICNSFKYFCIHTWYEGENFTYISQIIQNRTSERILNNSHFLNWLYFPYLSIFAFAFGSVLQKITGCWLAAHCSANDPQEVVGCKVTTLVKPIVSFLFPITGLLQCILSLTRSVAGLRIAHAKFLSSHKLVL